MFRLIIIEFFVALAVTNEIYTHPQHSWSDLWLTTIIIGAVTSDGLTPLGLAVREGHLNIIKYLITECNVDINGKLG